MGNCLRAFALVLFFLVTSAGANAQTIPVVSTLPGLCRPGAVAMLQSDLNVYYCASPNIWVLLGPGGVGGGAGDVSSNTASSTDGQLFVASGTGGKTLKLFTQSGVLKSTAGVVSPVSGTSTDCVKVDGTSGACGSGGGVAWVPTRTSATVLTLPAIAANTMAVGTYACPAIASGETFTVSSGTGTLWAALGSDCTVKIRHNIVGSCSAGCTAVGSSSGFDPSDLPLYQWDVTTGSLAASGTSKLIPNMSVALAAGTNVTIATVNGVSTISAASGASYNPLDRTVAYLRDEFQPAIQNDAATPILGQLAWMRQSNISASYSTANLSKDHPGILRITNPSAAVAAIDLAANSAAVLANPTAYAGWEAQFTFRLLATASTTIRVGFYNAFANNPTDYFGLIFSGGTDTNWQVVMRAASGSTLTADSGVAVSTSNWYTMRVRSLVAGTFRVSFSTNGGAFSTEKTICASGCDVSGTMPTTVMTPFFYVYNSSATTSMDIDWFGLNVTGLTR